jgi:hypothetical protein
MRCPYHLWPARILFREIVMAFGDLRLAVNAVRLRCPWGGGILKEAAVATSRTRDDVRALGVIHMSAAEQGGDDGPELILFRDLPSRAPPALAAAGAFTVIPDPCKDIHLCEQRELVGTVWTVANDDHAERAGPTSPQLARPPLQLECLRGLGAHHDDDLIRQLQRCLASRANRSKATDVDDEVVTSRRRDEDPDGSSPDRCPSRFIE